jgi:hypothetical protein
LLDWLDSKAEPAAVRSMQGRRLLKKLIHSGRFESARKILKVRSGGSLKLRLDTLKLRCLLELRHLRG